MPQLTDLVQPHLQPHLQSGGLDRGEPQRHVEPWLYTITIYPQSLGVPSPSSPILAKCKPCSSSAIKYSLALGRRLVVAGYVIP
jgi:hypothetical protein